MATTDKNGDLYESWMNGNQSYVYIQIRKMSRLDRLEFCEYTFSINESHAFGFLTWIVGGMK